MSNVISLEEYKKKRAKLLIYKLFDSAKHVDESDDFKDRLARIKENLAKINAYMTAAKEAESNHE